MPSLADTLLERSLNDASLSERERDLILAAWVDELDSMIESPAGSFARPAPAAELEEERASPVEAFLQSIEVAGFRGIGERSRLDLEPGPGLTLVVGRNGSGKSSFAEALELLMTGTNHRWSNSRSKIWRDGWRNLHFAGSPWIEAKLTVTGQEGPTVIRHQWGEDPVLEDAETRVHSPIAVRVDEPACAFDALAVGAIDDSGLVANSELTIYSGDACAPG